MSRRLVVPLLVFAGSTPAFAALVEGEDPAPAGVSPALVADTLEPGESLVVEKTVTLPWETPKLDFVLLVDLSGSYGNDLPNIRAVAPGLFDAIQADVPDSRFALATFVDFPFAPWGSTSTGDYAYRLDQDFTTDRTLWLSAVNGMTIRWGGDLPESQYEGIYQLATGAGRDINGDGDFTDTGEVAPGFNAAFRPDATRVVAVTTDATFHQQGDGGGAFPYPGANQAQTIAALQTAGIKIISIKAPGAGSEMDALAAATGGSVVSSTATSSNIATAVLSGLETLSHTVTAVPDAACDPLLLSYVPASFTGVYGGESVVFEETITVPDDIAAADLDGDGYLTCTVGFYQDDVLVGEQVIDLYIPINAPPVALCQDLDLAADATCAATGSIDAGSFDPDGDAITTEITWTDTGEPADLVFPLGTHALTLTVTDPSGASDSCEATVVVTDTTPPVVTVGGGVELWPPNHKYVDLSLADCDIVVEDDCGGTLDVDTVAFLTGAYSDEPENARGNGDGNTVADIVLGTGADFSVRAERAGGGNGRVYGISFAVEDAGGNLSEATCTVSVPHSQNGVLAVDDGPAAGYTVE